MTTPTFGQVLNIAVVLVALYATLSTVCSSVHEWIAARLALRGWDLFRGVAQLVNGNDLAAAIFDHPLVNCTSPKPSQTIIPASAKTIALSPISPNALLSQSHVDPTVAFIGRGPLARFSRFFTVVRSGPPSYIDARNFSSCFWQIVATAAVNAPISGKLAAATGALPGLSLSAAGSQALVATANAAAGTAVSTIVAPADIMESLRTAVEHMERRPDLQKSLMALLAAAGDDYDRLLRATDGWFNAQMDRVTGWYKRRTKTVMCLIAFVLVSISGVDTTHVIKTLSSLNADVVQTLADRAPTKPPIAGGTSFDLTLLAHVDPMFWHNWKSDARGLALTWLAVWLGGPFWFEALSSLINVRSSGRKPARDDQPPR